LSLAYLGTSDFAAAVLRRLAVSPHAPTLAVTRPDRPKGRGRKLASPPVADAARELGIALAQPESLGELGDLRAYDDVIVCAYGALLREPLLSHPGLLNIHPSLLPRWRGAAPVERAIMAGDAETGVTIMGMVEALDAGPIHLQASESIRDDDDYGTLVERLRGLSGDLLLRALDERPAPREQPEEGMTYAEKIGPEDRQLDPARTAIENDRVVRALSPHIGAKAGELGVWRARPAAAAPQASSGDAASSGDDASPLASVAPGEIAVRDGVVLWGAAGGALELLEVQPPGGRRMAAADYARGRAS